MRSNIRLQIAFLLAAIGGGLLIYGVLQWRQLPQFSEKDLSTSIELNLGIDLARLGPDHAPTPEQIENMRRDIRSEIDAEIASDRDAARGWLLGGTVLLVMALAQILVQRYVVPRVVGNRRA